MNFLPYILIPAFAHSFLSKIVTFWQQCHQLGAVGLLHCVWRSEESWLAAEESWWYCLGSLEEGAIM